MRQPCGMKIPNFMIPTLLAGFAHGDAAAGLSGGATNGEGVMLLS
jgi:hypothetical protein